MPFTPLHFGPSAALGWCFRKKIDWPALMLSNVAVDLEPLTVSILRPGAPEHGFSHSFLGGAAVTALFSAAYVALAGRVGRSPSWKRVLLSSFIGVYSNMIIDALIYPEIRLLYPSDRQLFYGWLPESAVVWGCAAITAGWLVAWRTGRKNAS